MLFSSRTLRSIIAGESAVDLPSLQLRTRAGALEFLRAYGYDYDHPGDIAHAGLIKNRSIALLDDRILRQSESLPAAIRELQDIPTLLMWASSVELPPNCTTQQRRRLQAWSCVLLRVCHSLSHAINELNESYGPAIREQIAGRFEAHLFRAGDKLFLGQGEDRVELVAFSVRPTKTVEAATMKLLRAVENVAAGVFDWAGVRLVVDNEIDALLVVRYFRAHNVISHPNIIPGRCRNSMLSLDEIEPRLEQVEAQFASLGDKVREVRRLILPRREEPPNHQEHNEHSASDYRAIQFTCRELMRVPLGPEGRAARFFFPYEVQILDAKSYESATTGPASHDAYKERQLEAVRARVLAGT